MSNLQFDDQWLLLLAALPVLMTVGIYGIWQKRRGLRLFASVNLLPRLAPPIGWTRPLLRLALVVLCLILLVAAAIDPRWGEQEQTVARRNIDLIVLLDVSRSMLARDIAPNRLERAKISIRDDLLPALGGDHIGLITFAGATSLACPLTNDYGFFRLVLDDVSTESSPRGGTLIGDAIRAAAGFPDKLDTHKIILLITDGEDHDSLPVEAAGGLWEDQQIPIVAVALGDEREGARVPIQTGRGEEFLQYRDQVVWSRANFDDLRRIALAAGGGVFARVGRQNFIPVGTRNFDLGEIYRQVVLPAIDSQERLESETVPLPSRYHGFALAALVLLTIDSLLRHTPSPKSQPGAHLPVARAPGSDRAGGLALIVLLAVLPGVCLAASPRELIQQGNQHYAAGRHAEALEAYQQAAEVAGVDVGPELLHNQAAAQFRLGSLDEARELWVRALALKDAAWEARARYNLGNCAYAEALQPLASPPATGSPALEEVFERLDRAVAQYRDALRLDPELENARANLELAYQLRKTLEEQAQQQPQSQPSTTQQSKDDQQSSTTQPSDEQQSGAGEPGEQEQQDQPSTQPSTRPGDEEQQQEQPPEPSTQPSDASEEPAPEPATQPTEQADSAPPPQPEGTIRMTREEAERLLQMIRDAEKARRRVLRQRQAARHRKVERDW